MHEVETMFSARLKPWHYGSTKDRTIITEDVLTAKEAIVLAGLDWEVALEEIALVRNGKVLDERFAVVRQTDDKVFGTVGTRYVPAQNAEAFDFFDNLVANGEAKYETAGALKGGRRVFITAKIGTDILIGGQDAHEMYLLLSTTHDGTGSTSVYVVMVRVVCQNTLTAAINGAAHRWSVPHVTSLQGKILEARETLGMTFNYRDEFVEFAESLMETTVSDARFEGMLNRVLPNRPRTEQVVQSIMQNRRTSPTIEDGWRDTGWGAYNALTEYFDWQRVGSREGQAQVINITAGTNAKMRDRLASLLVS